jgi:hypothetical protein
MQFNGGIIGKLVTPSSNAASGIWPLFQLENAVLSSNWPKEAVTITGVTILPTDVYFPSVTLLLKSASSSYTGKSTTTVDSSNNNLTVTRNGTPLTALTGPYQTDGYWSNYFGTTTSDNIYAASNAAYTVGTNNFTVEFWAYWTAWSSTNQRMILMGQSGSSPIEISRDSAADVLKIYTNTSAKISYTWTPSLSTWYHVAVVRSGTGTNQLVLYINGINVATGTSADSIAANNFFIGGLNWATGYNMQGYISNVRFVNGTAVYTGNFTPPTAPLATTQSAGTNIAAITGTQTTLLTCQSNRFKDNSTNNFSLTINGAPTVRSDYYPSGFAAPAASTGAALFNGSTDYLSAPSSTNLGVSNGNFTVEFWYFQSGARVSSYPTIIHNASTWAANSWGVLVDRTDSAGKVTVWVNNVNSVSPVITSTTSISVGAWYYIAVVRNSATLSLYINGSLDSTANVSTTSFDSGTNPLYIGWQGTNTFLNGYLSNLRLVKGTAVYTGAFTPPSGPLTQNGGTYPSTTNVNTNIPASNTSLLLNFAESNYTSSTTAIQNNVFVDDSNYAATITRNGTPIQGSVTPYWPSGQWSNYFDGSNSYIRTTGVSFTNPSFTIECWFYFAGSPANQAVYDFSATIGTYGVYTSFNGSNLTTSFYSTSSSASLIGQINTPYTNYLNKWVHLAVTFDGVTYRMFLNGVSVGTPVLSSTQIVTVTVLTVGGRSDSTQVAGYGWVGYVSNFRYVRGTAVYTGNFVPPTSPLTAITNTVLLTAQDNRFKDNSINKFTITPSGSPTTQVFQPFPTRTQYSPASYSGSAYFNGSTDNLTIPNNTVFEMGSSDYTLELWYYALTNNDAGLVFKGTYSNGSNTWVPGFGIRRSGNSGFIFYFNTNTTLAAQVAYTATVSNPENMWHHVAMVVKGGIGYAYLNGVLLNVGGTSGVGTLPTGADGLTIAKFPYSPVNISFTGYISNVRLVKGTAVYTGAFTPPTEPLTKITNTSLLLNFTNAAIYDATTQNNLISVGDVQSSNSQTKWSPTSMKFDGSGDLLYTPSNVALDLAAVDFTIEFWFNANSISSGFACLVGKTNWPGSSGSGWAVFQNNQQIVFFYPAASTDGFGTGNVITSTGTWYYVAIVRSGTATNNTKIYINGVQQAQGTSTISASTNGMVVGGINPTYGWNNSFYTNGYIQDLRITKGVARTVTTVPTTEFETLGVN